MKLINIFETTLPTVKFVSLFEAPKVGREYQHIEDLLILDGAKGGIEAVNELKHIVNDPSTMNMKWDGGAAVYWGRNQNGTFIFAPKNQWDKGNPLDKEELIAEIEGTGRPRQGQSQEEFTKIRKEMANNYKRLWNIFERATPKNFRGYLNGDLMFTEKQIPNDKGYYEFTPNKVTYRVALNGLYNKISTAQAFVAVHGKLNNFGIEASGNLQPVSEGEIQQFNRTPELIVLPTQHPNVKLNLIDQEAESLLTLIKNNAIAIDSIANFKADKMSGFKKILYDYVVKLAKNNDNLDFINWLKNSKLSNNQKDIIEKLIDTNYREWEIFWNAFKGIKKLKHSVLENLHNAHGKKMANNLGITAITNNKMGGEGFIKQANNGGMIKLVNPEFRSAPDNSKFISNLNEAHFDKIPKTQIKQLFKNLQLNNEFIIFTLSYLQHYINLPNLEEKLNEYKTRIIKIFLIAIKNDRYQNDTIVKAIDSLKRLGVKWPELDIIEKSIKVDNQINEIDIDDKNQLEESKFPKFELNSYISTLLYWLDTDNKFSSDNEIFFTLSAIGYNYENNYIDIDIDLPNIVDKLDPHKHKILKSILIYIRENIIDDPNNDKINFKISIVIRVIKVLESFGLNWPELNSIEKSMKASQIDESFVAEESNI